MPNSHRRFPTVATRAILHRRIPSSFNCWSMLLERRTVSRKTPRDGKLEISGVTEAAVARLGSTVLVEWQGREAPASVARMSCTCAKGTGQHQHVFLESELFRAL